MKKELFELLGSVREGGAILRGELEPARTFRLDDPDVRSVREKYGLSQPRFAALMGISVGTLRNWEQGRRKPEGSARVLLRVVASIRRRCSTPWQAVPSPRSTTPHPSPAWPAARSADPG